MRGKKWRRQIAPEAKDCHAGGPNILFIHLNFSKKDFWRVIWTRVMKSIMLNIDRGDGSRFLKVTKLEVIVAIHQDVLQFDVPMNEAHLVKRGDSTCDEIRKGYLRIS